MNLKTTKGKYNADTRHRDERRPTMPRVFWCTVGNFRCTLLSVYIVITFENTFNFYIFTNICTTLQHSRNVTGKDGLCQSFYALQRTGQDYETLQLWSGVSILIEFQIHPATANEVLRLISTWGGPANEHLQARLPAIPDFSHDQVEALGTHELEHFSTSREVAYFDAGVESFLGEFLLPWVL